MLIKIFYLLEIISISCAEQLSGRRFVSEEKNKLNCKIKNFNSEIEKILYQIKKF